MENRGFTLIELIVIITVIGVLAVSATARFGGTEAFEVRGFRDQLAAAARSAQRYARNSGCPTTFSYGSGSWSVSTTVPCGGSTQTVSAPGRPLTGSIPGSVSISPASLAVTFDAFGSTGSSSSISVSSGSASAAFTISPSGYVDLP